MLLGGSNLYTYRESLSRRSNQVLLRSGQDKTPTTDGPHQAALAWLQTFDLTPCYCTFAACAAASQHPVQEMSRQAALRVMLTCVYVPGM